MAYGVVRLDNVKSVYGGHIESLKPADTSLVVQNGFVGKAGDLLPKERELRRLEIAKKGDSIVLIHNGEINYSESLNAGNLERFAQEAGKASRGYTLERLDIFSLSDDLITPLATKPEAGNYVVVDEATFKLKEIATPVGDEKFVGKIVAKEQLGSSRFVTGQPGILTSFVPLTVIEVVQN